MSDTLHPDERAYYEAALRRRVDRLARITRTSGVTVGPVLAIMVWHVVKTALPLCGAHLRNEFFGWLGQTTREDAGLCPFCGATKSESSRAMCDRCVEEGEQLDRDLALEDADESRPM